MLTEKMLIKYLDDIAAMDNTVRVAKKNRLNFRKKQVRASPYSRDAMFSAMAKRSIAVFKEVPGLMSKNKGDISKKLIVQTLSKKISPRTTSRVQVGPSHTSVRLPVRKIMNLWERQRAIVGVTDFHIRGTPLENLLDLHALSDFNILICGSEELSLQEMMTLVIASPGNVTDSHSDDPDGTNHCFVGKKLWLAWETFEGMEVGLQDVSRQTVYGNCDFSISKFLSLRSARWFIVSTGDTLFLPGNFTHKVFTLEPYIGVGSFHVGLPGSLDNLSRWLFYGPLWSIDDHKKENESLVEEMIALAVRIARRAQSGSERTRERWGYRQLPYSYRLWLRNTNSRIKKLITQHPKLAELIEIAKDSGQHLN